jgi:hypothetical protein
LDPKLITIGQTFIRHHFFSVFFAHFISLIFLLCYLPVRLTLLRTGRSSTKLRATRRYLTTLLHIKSWYESDLLTTITITSPSSSSSGSGSPFPHGGVEDIRRIRTLHYRLARSLNSKLNSSDTTGTTTTATLKNVKGEEDVDVEDEDNNNNMLLVKGLREDLNPKNGEFPTTFPGHQPSAETLPVISQLDMAVTQFCFMGFISLYPTVFGIAGNGSEEGLKGFVHVWALIGYHLGIEDEFNLCLESNIPTRHQILPQILLPNFREVSLDTVQLWSALAGGIASIVPCISLPAILLYTVTRVLKMKSAQLQAHLSPYDSFCYRLMGYCFNSWIAKSFLRTILNSLLRLAVFLTAIRLNSSSSSASLSQTTGTAKSLSQSQPQPKNNNNNNLIPSPTSHV